MVSISSRTAAVSALLSSSGVVHIYRQIDVSATVIKLLPSPIPIIPVAGISKPPIPQAVSTDEDEAVGADENEVVEPETNLESDTEETIAPSSAPLERIWKLESTLVPLESAPQSRFGHALHLTGNFSLISSFAEDGSGQVNVYERFPLPEQGGNSTILFCSDDTMRLPYP